MAKTTAHRQNERATNSGSNAADIDSGKVSVAEEKNPETNKKDVQHVIEHNGNWVVKDARSGRFLTQFYPNKSEAIDAGRLIANTLGGELLVHGRSGQIFQHSPVPSTLPEDIIRQAIRSANEGAHTAVRKTSPSRSLKKTVTKKK